jgi:hypothetical protein
MLPAVAFQRRELRVDRVQVACETIELRARLGELRNERLAILGCYGFHETTWAAMFWCRLMIDRD